MAREIINIGFQPNDGTGDTLRSTAIKINKNFEQLFDIILRDSDSAGISDSDIQYVSKQINFVGNIFDNILTFNEGSQEVTNTLPNESGIVLNTLANQYVENKTFKTVMLSDSDNGNHYSIVPSSLNDNIIINLPTILDSDTFIFEDTYQTLTNKTHIKPRVVNYIADFFGAPILGIDNITSASNNLSISNALKGQAPKITVVSNPTDLEVDSDVDLQIESLGRGVIKINNPLVKDNEIIDFTSNIQAVDTISLLKEVTRFTGDSDGIITMDNPINESNIFNKTLINTSSNNVEIIPTNFVNGTSIVMKPNSVVELFFVEPNGWMLKEPKIYDETEINTLWYVK